MTNLEIEKKLSQLVLEERKLSHEILKLINLSLEKCTYLEFAYSSMFDWLVNGFGYSESAAYRRIEAARLLKSVPEVFEKLEAGVVNLTTLSKAQSTIRQQEKISGQKIPLQMKKEIVSSIENKSAKETEQILIATFPLTASTVYSERKTVVDENQIRLHMNLSNKTALDLKRAKEVFSHKFPDATDAEIIGYALEKLLDMSDPLRKAEKVRSSQKIRLVEQEKENLLPIEEVAGGTQLQYRLSV